MLINIILLLVGLLLILSGANFLTDGASSVAKQWGVSGLVIGLTIVAFGTSAPELAISILSALQGSAEMSIGNVVGSNIFNILVIVGCVAIVTPIKVENSIMNNEIPLVILACLALFICSNGVALDGDTANYINRTSGLLLLLFFVIFMRYTFSIAKKNTTDSATPEQIKEYPIWISCVYIIGGLAALIGGGELFVNGASGVAKQLNVSESIIGLTIVGAGTSLPELATSIVAALKKQSGLAIGNVVGSCLFNIFLVLGASAVISPLPLGGITNLDMLTMLGAAILFWLFGWFFKTRTITRVEGALMFSCYIFYVVLLIGKL